MITMNFTAFRTLITAILLFHTSISLAGSIDVPVGKPTFELQLSYLKKYTEKPSHGANVYYYDNGIYKVVSPHDNHYGSYVIEGDRHSDAFTIRHIAMPSQDWQGKSAFIKLTLDNKSHHFIQNTLTDKQYTPGKVPFLYGSYVMKTNTVTTHETITWKSATPSEK